MMAKEIYTIGHSNLDIPDFIRLLIRNGINVIADVRSVPHSGANPQFDRAPLADRLSQHAIAYVFLGNELGGRSTNSDCYLNEQIQYDLIARTGAFKRGLSRLALGLQRGFKIALMCAERDPIQCHRAILIAPHLVRQDVVVKHIFEAGTLEVHEATMKRLIDLLKIDQVYIGLSQRELFERAYQIQGDNIAFRRQQKHLKSHPSLPLT